MSATMMLAHMLGIKVFATGGIGGVHRGVHETLDISADLEEFTKTPVLVVCSGAKSILDIPKTLEYLETKGVPVLCSQIETFPAFYSRTSPFNAPLRVQDLQEAAKIISFHFSAHAGGIILANPIPERDEIPFEEVETWIHHALTDAAQQSISGKSVTPFLLNHLRKASMGRTLAANIALLLDNAQCAAKMATLLSRAS